MTTATATRIIVKRLTKAGFVARKAKGSHTMFSKGAVDVSVPTGHRMVSPGVVRQVDRAIEAASKEEDR